MTDKEKTQEYIMALIEKGANAMLDEIIENHLKKHSSGAASLSVKHFLETGTINGEFLLSLREMLKYYGKISEEAMEYVAKIEASSRLDECKRHDTDIEGRLGVNPNGDFIHLSEAKEKIKGE
jgi:hypothetical protein